MTVQPDRPWERDDAARAKAEADRRGNRGCLITAGVVVAAVVALSLVTSLGGPDNQSGVDRAEITASGGEWPLTVDAGTVRCDPGNRLVFTPEGDETEYALNGLAKGAGFADIRPIWKDDPQFEGLKVGIGDLIDYGLELCE